jgi:hypothetical protein
MAKAITAQQIAADRELLTAIKNLMAAYNQTKVVGTAGYMDWAKAEKLMLQAAVRKNARGNTGFRGDISAVGQVP